jgi:hypothetical protein
MNTEGKAKETANSRDGLDDYIRVSSPGVTAVIIAFLSGLPILILSPQLLLPAAAGSPAGRSSA